VTEYYPEEPDGAQRMADALERLATIAEKWLERAYPEKRHVRDATLTVVTSPAERDLAESLQGSEPSLEHWKDIGPIEEAFLNQKKKS
jgi:hypothetical protein